MLQARGLDFADAGLVFVSARSITIEDNRFDYGEARFVIYGWMRETAVAVVWTERGDARRIISMRRMHQWEILYVGLD